MTPPHRRDSAPHGVNLDTSCVVSEQVIAQEIGVGIWRVRDRNVPEHDALCVLGVIEEHGDGFDTLFIGEGARRRYAHTFDAALREFVLRHQLADSTHA